MKAVVLAAGVGTRLRPLTDSVPKVMLKLNGKPILEHVVEILAKKGLKEIVMVVSYKKEVVMQHFGDGKKFGLHIEYVAQKNHKGGTADAVRCAREKIKDNKFFVVYGDNVFDDDVIDEMIKKSEMYDGLVCGKEVKNPKLYGILEVKGDELVKIIEKPMDPPSNLANTGLFVLPKKIFEAIDKTKLSARGEYELTDSIQILIKEGYSFGCVKIRGFWSDIGSLEELESVKKHFAD
jgi:bifunctional UDP-N-acetylglucosamine pyrophosphorylase/glucosamine-1-phosphate N-acetyltransferase